MPTGDRLGGACRTLIAHAVVFGERPRGEDKIHSGSHALVLQASKAANTDWYRQALQGSLEYIGAAGL